MLMLGFRMSCKLPVSRMSTYYAAFVKLLLVSYIGRTRDDGGEGHSEVSLLEDSTLFACRKLNHAQFA